MTRFAVGIDLGTTHCALAAAPLDDPGSVPEVFSVPQLVAPAPAPEGPQLWDKSTSDD